MQKKKKRRNFSKKLNNGVLTYFIKGSLRKLGNKYASSLILN